MDNLKQAGAIHQGWTTMIDESIQPRYQSAVLYGTDEQLEARLPKHTRRLIQDAVKRNVHIQFGHSELVPEFSRLVTLTEERKGVNLRNEQYFQRLMDVYGQDAVILLAMCNVKELKEAALKQKENVEHELAVLPDNAKKKRHRLEEQLASVTKSLALYDSLFEGDIPEGELAIAGILSINYGHTCEMLYAGMDERFKQFMPQYMEYMENFKWAFAKGMTEASMGGVEGTLDDGLTRFKDNFSPVIQEFIGEFDLPVNKLLYKPAKWAYEKVKHKMNQ
jgi:serine/alanine adding enzyme